MRRMLLSMVLLTAASTALADIDWSVTAAPVLGPVDETNPGETVFTSPLTGNYFDATGGYLAQLIWAGNDLTINPADLGDPTGVGGDDVVVDTRWFGAGRFPDEADGYFIAGDSWGGGSDDALDDLSVGQNFYMRAWVGVSQDPIQVLNGEPAARIPTLNVAGLLWYGNSEFFVNLGDDPEMDGGAPTVNGVDFGLLGAAGGSGGDFVANQVIPEPASFLLLLLSAMLLGRRARRH